MIFPKCDMRDGLLCWKKKDSFAFYMWFDFALYKNRKKYYFVENRANLCKCIRHPGNNIFQKVLCSTLHEQINLNHSLQSFNRLNKQTTKKVSEFLCRKEFMSLTKKLESLIFF
jgi:hypothetical protein